MGAHCTGERVGPGPNRVRLEWEMPTFSRSQCSPALRLEERGLRRTTDFEQLRAVPTRPQHAVPPPSCSRWKSHRPSPPSTSVTLHPDSARKVLRHLPSIIKDASKDHFLFVDIMSRWEERRHHGRSQATVNCRQDAWAWKAETTASWRHPATPHKVRFCKLWSGDLGEATSLLTALVSLSKISHCKSTVVRKNGMLHAKHLAGGLAHTLRRVSNCCYHFIIINKDNPCQK